MANTIEIVIKATDSASQVISKVESNVSGSTQKLVKNFDEVGKASQTAQQKIQDFGAGMAGLGDKLSIGVTLPLVAAGTAAIKFASDLNETTSKIGVLFGDMSTDIKKWADTAATSFGLSKKAALDGAADFAIFGKAAGLAGKDLTEFSKQNVKLASDMASFFNTSPEEAITAIGAAFRGESEPIRRYGVLINDVALKDEALRQGLIKTTTDALTPQQRILAASALIMKQTSAAQGDFARTSDQLANSTRIAKAQLEDAAATLGTNLLPLVNKGINFVNGLLKAFQDLSPEMQNAILAFGGIAAAMGPVMSVGGRLIGSFAALKGGLLDAAGGMASIGRTVGDTAKYIKDAGLSADSLKFAFQNLKAGGALLGAELAIIVAGLIAVTKYLGEVDAASKATTDNLLKMANSGDIFKQAAASTEIMINGQERLNKVVRDVSDKLKEGGKSYEAYRAGVLGAAVAAGTLTQVQSDEYLETGKITDAQYHQFDVTQELTKATGLLTKAQYEAIPGTGQLGIVFDKLTETGKQFLSIIAPIGAASKQTSSDIFTGTQEQIGGLKQLVDAYQATGEADKERQDIAAQMIDIMKANNGAMADAYNMAITYTESQRKQADVQAELDALNIKIAGGIDNYNQKLGEHTTAVQGATEAELKQKAALEEQLATLQKTDEINRAKGAFESLTKAFRDGLLTQEQYQARASALNEVANLYTTSALQQATAQEVLMKAFADPASSLWQAQLEKNKTAIDGQVESTNKAVEATDALNKKQAETPPTVQAKVEKIEIPKDLPPIEVSIKPKIEKAEIDNAKLAHDLAGDLKYAQPTITPKVDTTTATADIQKYTENYVSIIPKEKTTVIKADTVAATKNTNDILKLFGVIPEKKLTTVDVDGKQALQTTDDIIRELEKIIDKVITITVKYKTEGPPPAGLQFGGSLIVPPNPMGGAGDYFPILAAPGERVTVQTRAQQAAGGAPPIVGGDTYIYNTNVYNPLAAAMLADKQRRDRLARSNARMGVQA